MKKRNRVLIMILALLVSVPIFWNYSTSTVSAATPKFAKSKVEFVGVGEKYQLVINSKVKGSTYKWTSSNKEIVKVSSKGVITTVGGGSTTVKCKITYPTKKTKTLVCAITVKVPASEIRITNAALVNGVHKLTLGSTMDFNIEMVPAMSTDMAYWYVDKGNKDSISVDDPKEGVVTARKVGTVTLKVKAAASATAAAAKESIFEDSVIIEVVEPMAKVQSAEIVNTTEIKVVFESPVNSSTVIETGNKLSSNITVTLGRNSKGVLAADPGNLTTSLSTDGKTLTITASKTFDGEYGISCTNKILTTTGIAIEAFYKTLSFIDNFPPTLLGVTMDDSGFKADINFSEPMDFTNLSVTGASVLNGTNASANTISILNNRLNYVASADKKALIIDLSTIASTDYGKFFSVTLAGAKDLAGNVPASYTLTATLRADNTLKSQAVPLYVARTGYNTLTATFSRSLSYPGYLQVKNGYMITGVIDSTDRKKVNYTINDVDAGLTGNNEVRLSMWNSYNVITTDSSAQVGKTFIADFTIDKSNPILVSCEFDVPTSTLILTYNKEVALANAAGVITTTLDTITDDIRDDTNINYTKIADEANKKVVKLKISNMSILGSYTFTLENGFVTDVFKNPSLIRTVSISNSTGTSTELPAPYSITQSASNLSQISIDFAAKLDKASAENASNYAIPGVSILSARLKNNTADSGATVLLTVADGTIDATVERPVKINGVMGYNSSYSAIKDFSKMVLLKDNKKPFLMEPLVFDKTTRNAIKMNFSEQITGSLVVKVTLISNPSFIFSNTVTVNGNAAYITLESIPANGTGLKIEVVNNTLTDASGNTATMNNTLFTTIIY
jgi:hypothetical protein